MVKKIRLQFYLYLNAQKISTIQERIEQEHYVYKNNISRLQNSLRSEFKKNAVLEGKLINLKNES